MEPGETADDTAIAGAVVEVYRGGSLDLRMVRDAMLRWEDFRPKDIGNQTRRAFGYLRSHPEALSLPEDPEAQENGTVIRAAARGDDRGRRRGDRGRLEARASGALVASLVAHLTEGTPPEEALEASFALVETRDRSGKRVGEVLRPLYGYEHNPGGSTVYATRLALPCLLEASDFRSGLGGVIPPVCGHLRPSAASTSAALVRSIFKPFSS